MITRFEVSIPCNSSRDIEETCEPSSPFAVTYEGKSGPVEDYEQENHARYSGSKEFGTVLVVCLPEGF